MSDRYLFKAKRLDNGEWVEGYLFFIVDIPYIICDGETMCMDGENTDLYATEWYEVDENTICQCTGLTDKNGNKKWRGDIFECSNGDYLERYYIEWDEANLQWEAVCIADSDGNLPLCEFSADEIDVIGNIFDNPELLEREG